MKWNLLNTGFNTGKFNMDYDIKLALTCPDDQAYLRFYRWTPYCISLGANQRESDLDMDAVKENGIGVARRPTGGRAILHAEELTYSVILPLASGMTAREIYTKVSFALVKGLKKYSAKLNDVELENLQPNFAELLKEPSGMLCFASTAKSEVKFKGKKLIGSAQRKLNKVVLQHGSILGGTYHQDLPKYLADKENIDHLMDELKDKTTEIETITGEMVDYKVLTECIVAGFEDVFDIMFNDKPELDLNERS